MTTETWARELRAVAFSRVGDLVGPDGMPLPVHLLPAHVQAAIASCRSRELRRKGLRFIGFHIRETEVAELIRRRLLAETDRDDSNAIETALGKLLDQMLAPKHASPAR